MSWPRKKPAKTRIGATRSATWVLAPTVMPIARSILSARANRTALNSSAAFPTDGQQEDAREERREPHALGGRIDRAGEDLAHERQCDRHRGQDRERLVPAPVDLHLWLDLGRRNPRLFLLGLHARLSHDRLVGHQRENQAREVHEKQDDRNLERNVPAPGSSPPSATMP